VRDRHAHERGACCRALSAHEEPPRLVHRAIARHGHEGAEAWILAVDAREIGGRDLERRHGASGVGLRQLSHAKRRQVGGRARLLRRRRRQCVRRDQRGNAAERRQPFAPRHRSAIVTPLSRLARNPRTNRAKWDRA
jgi:hypothetical protein